MRNIILDLCGGTGAWSRPYREAGYCVEVITLPAHDVMRVELDNYAMEFKDLLSWNPACTTCILYEDIVGILAAPPCTEFSVAKNSKPRDLRSGMDIVDACMRLIWETQIHTRLDFWALENPRGLLRRFLGVPRYTFEQWQFGETRIKATDVWGYFNIPRPTVNTKPDGLTRRYPNGRTNARDWTRCEYPQEYETYMNSLPYDEKRAAARAITPAGFAQAFFRANNRSRKEVPSG